MEPEGTERKLIIQWSAIEAGILYHRRVGVGVEVPDVEVASMDTLRSQISGASSSATRQWHVCRNVINATQTPA
jgi:hypothetical protein